VPHGLLISWALMSEGGVQINAHGQRFHDESHGYSEAAVPVLAQPGGTAWNVFDDPILALARGFPDFQQAESVGAVKTASDTAALARLIGCPTEVLEATLQAVAPGAPDAFGRQFVRPLRPPFHAVRVTGALFHTQGGLDIDADGRVLRADGSCLPNLWAAGGAARGVSGNRLEGYLSGNGLLSAVAGGWLAAHSMARQLAAAT
jgi:fumarate reductase flavoprotein subunit